MVLGSIPRPWKSIVSTVNCPWPRFGLYLWELTLNYSQVKFESYFRNISGRQFESSHHVLEGKRV